MRHLLFAAFAGSPALAPSNVRAQETSPEVEAVRAAVLDYVEGIYDAAPERIERSVHPDLAKFGFWKGRDDPDFESEPMTFEELVETARTWNAAGRDLSSAPRFIEVDAVLERTASARLIAAWGVDYLHLVRTEDGWRIRNVVWQSHTPETIAMVERLRADDDGGS